MNISPFLSKGVQSYAFFLKKTSISNKIKKCFNIFISFSIVNKCLLLHEVAFIFQYIIFYTL